MCPSVVIVNLSTCDLDFIFYLHVGRILSLLHLPFIPSLVSSIHWYSKWFRSFPSFTLTNMNAQTLANTYLLQITALSLSSLTSVTIKCPGRFIPKVSTSSTCFYFPFDYTLASVLALQWNIFSLWILMPLCFPKKIYSLSQRILFHLLCSVCVWITFHPYN